MTIYYSCDSHVVEPPEVFDGLIDRFGDRAPRPVDGWKDRDGVWIAWPALDRVVPVGRWGIAGHSLDDPQTHERIKLGWDGMNPGVRDPVARLDEQTVDGIVGEVMYPSINLLTYSVEDIEVTNAVFQNYNDWIVNYCSPNPNRLIGIGCVPLRDVDLAVSELHRAAKMGVKGVAIPCTAPIDRPYSDPYYEPFWEAANEIGLPLTMHIFSGSDWPMALPQHWDPIVAYTLSHAAIWNSVSNIVTSGVVERHPNLKFVVAEWETGWVAHTLQRWDHAFYRSRTAASPDLTMLPSEYFKRNFMITFEDDEVGLRTLDHLGPENLLWGNDYPHHDSIWPNSMDVLNTIMEGIPDASRDKMVWENVRDLYQIDETKLLVN